MQKRISFLISLLVLVLAGIVIYQQGPKWLNLFKENSSEKDKLEVFMATVDDFIQKNRLDSASAYLDGLLSQRKDMGGDTQLLDTVQVLRWQIKQIGLLDTGNIYIGVLLNLSDHEYEDFLNKKLNKRYLAHPGLNRIYLNKLYAENQKRDMTSTESAVHPSGPTQYTAADLVTKRKQVAESIKNSFMSLGFDITVEISGTDSTRLILTAAEFNDEWFEKFESDSDMAEWHNLGFKQVEIRNNSGYSKIKSW